MIKRTLYFGNPTYLRSSNDQLVFQLLDDNLTKSAPIEDIGLLVLDNQQITITQTAMVRLLENNVAMVVCDDTHHPAGIFYNLEGNTLQSQKFQVQIEASVPLKKQLWQQTIIAKIQNQANLLKHQKLEVKYLENLIKTVKSGDSDNNEAKAASFYWKRIFPETLAFSRDRYGPQPNNLLNYGYAILRAMVARALVGSGLMPTLGINHKNQYNAFCLADDIMEPYRPYVDKLVCEIIRENGSFMELSHGIKRHLLTIPAMDVHIDGKKSPMINAISRTTASLVRCYEGVSRKILYPELK